MGNIFKPILKKISLYIYLFFKYSFLLIFILFLILSISIFISSLSSYKESDFNIPDNFFETKHHNKDINSKNNGFKDYLNFINFLENQQKDNSFYYFYIKGSCTFNIDKYSSCVLEKDSFNNKKVFKEIVKNEYSKEIISKYIYGFDDELDKKLDKILKKRLGKTFYEIISEEENNSYKEKFIENNYKKFRIFYNLSTIKIKNINNKEFIKPDYSEIIKNYFIIYYLKATIHLVYEEFERGNIEKGVDILINNQKFIDNLTYKSDNDWRLGLFLAILNKINIESINYFIKNYEINNKLKSKITYVLEKNLRNNISIVNGLKHDYKYMNELINNSQDIRYILNEIPLLGNFPHNSLYELFYSKSETLVLLKDHYYYLIKNELQDTNYIDLNLNNYLGREFINDNKKFNIKKLFDKEKKLLKLRESIIKELE